MAIDRRDFVTRASALAAMGMVSAPVLAAAEAGGDPIADWIVVNALGGLGDPNSPPDGTRSAISQRVLADAHASGVTAINITLGYVAGPEEPFEDTVRDIATTDRMIRDNPRDLIKILSAADIRRAKAEKKVGLLYGFQNCAMLGKDATRVDVFADLGVRVFQLTYNPANLLGDGSMAPENRGLTPFGREVIARLNDRRVMVDPRNKTDAELRLVAERGGFVGIYFMPFLNQSGHATAEDVVAHIDHAVNLCGEDHVGIGTDGTVTQIDDLKVYEAKLAKEIADRRAAGISATGERPDTYPFVVDLRGPDQFRKLARLLEAKGYSPRRVEKILGLNFLRYAETIWGG